MKKYDTLGKAWPVCPHCGYDYEALKGEEKMFKGKSETKIWWCGICDKPLHITVAKEITVDYYYTTTKAGKINKSTKGAK